MQLASIISYTIKINIWEIEKIQWTEKEKPFSYDENTWDYSLDFHTFRVCVCVCVCVCVRACVRTQSLSCVWLLYVPFSRVNCNHHVVFPFLSAYLSYKWKLVLFGQPTLIPTILDTCHFQREFVHIIIIFFLSSASVALFKSCLERCNQVLKYIAELQGWKCIGCIWEKKRYAVFILHMSYIKYEPHMTMYGPLLSSLCPI